MVVYSHGFRDPYQLCPVPSCDANYAASRMNTDSIMEASIDLDMTTLALAMTPPGGSISHLLSLPQEVKHMIWRALLELISTRRQGDWFSKPAFEFGALSCTCRQLYHEIKDFRPQYYLIAFSQFPNFISEFAVNYHNPAKYRSLVLQFSHDASDKMFLDLSHALLACSKQLEELYLSFTGPDDYGTPIYLHGCAYAPKLGKQKILPPDGQNIGSKMELLWAILQMTRIRILTISNLNLQLFQAVFKHKPRLQYVHITADPRSAIHSEIGLSSSGYGLLLVTPTEYFPPVKVLHIDGNSMLNAFNFPSTCAMTLEHLTWTIPEWIFNYTSFGIDLYSNTRQLMDNLALNARKLTTLRICVKGDGLYGHVTQYTELERALTGSLRQLTSSLKNLEIHLVKKSSNLGYSILTSLPHSVERFYANDRLVSPRELHDFISERYLGGVLGQLASKTTDPVERRLELWHPQHPLALPADDYFPQACNDTTCKGCEKIQIGFDPVSFDVRYHHDGHILSPSVLVERRCCDKQKRFPLYLEGIIGEDPSRKDYIPAVVGSLQFIDYEFADPDYRCRTGGVGETVTQMVLRINGRLIDRARNMFRIYWPQSKRHEMPPTKYAESKEKEVMFRTMASKHRGIDHLLKQLYEVEFTHPRDHDLKTALKELMESQFTEDARYFGGEDRAFWLFHQEPVARPETRSPPRYPYYVDSCGEKDDQCH